MAFQYSNNAYPSSEPLAFFSGGGPAGGVGGGAAGSMAGAGAGQSYYPGSRSSLEGNMNMNMAAGAYGSMQSEGRWWEAFGTGGYDGEPGLMEGTYQINRRRAIQDGRASIQAVLKLDRRAEIWVNS